MLDNFSEYVVFEQAIEAYDEMSNLIGLLSFLEGRKNPERLRQSSEKSEKEALKAKKEQQPGLFGDIDIAEPDYAKRPEVTTCPVTPLSSYVKEIGTIQNYALANPDNFAQVMMFSPISANVSFGKHWDNFPVLMTILRYFFPNKVTAEELKDVVDAFTDQYYNLKATLQSWKFNTIAYVWSNRNSLFSRLKSLNKEHDAASSETKKWVNDRKKEGSKEYNNLSASELKEKIEEITKKRERKSLSKIIMEMLKIPGVAPVKAGFMAQLLFGKAGCIDTHNVDIYKAAFPDLSKELEDKLWAKDTEWTRNPIDIQKFADNPIRANLPTSVWSSLKKTKKSVGNYLDILDKLKQRGIGTAELWDVWVDFVGFMYHAVSEGGRGLYASFDPALNPNDPRWNALKTVVTKEKITASGKKTGRMKDVPVITGSGFGGGAGATHTIAAQDPETILRAFWNVSQGNPAPEWARAIARDLNPNTGLPYNKIMGPQQGMWYYFKSAIDPTTGKVDPDKFKSIILDRIKEQESKPKQMGLFGGVPTKADQDAPDEVEPTV